MPTTELAVFPLREGIDVYDESSEARKTFKSLTELVSKQKGVQSWHSGVQVEHAKLLQFSIVWDTYEAHTAFMKTEIYPQVIEKANTLIDESPEAKVQMAHADILPESEYHKVIAAPVTEVVTFYFDGAAPSGYLDDIKKFTKAVHEVPKSGFVGLAAGITYEELEREGVKGKAAVVLIGWSSIDAHVAFRELDVFKENAHLLRGGMKKAEMHHVKFTRDF